MPAHHRRRDYRPCQSTLIITLQNLVNLPHGKAQGESAIQKRQTSKLNSDGKGLKGAFRRGASIHKANLTCSFLSRRHHVSWANKI